MKDFVSQDLLEDRPRLRIVVDQLAIDRETAGGRFLRHVEEREQTVVGLAIDPEVVEAVTARQRIAVEQDRRAPRLSARSSAAPRSRNRSP